MCRVWAQRSKDISGRAAKAARGRSSPLVLSTVRTHFRAVCLRASGKKMIHTANWRWKLNYKSTLKRHGALHPLIQRILFILGKIASCIQSSLYDSKFYWQFVLDFYNLFEFWISYHLNLQFVHFKYNFNRVICSVQLKYFIFCMLIT